jgi:hypothetical protein
MVEQWLQGVSPIRFSYGKTPLHSCSTFQVKAKANVLRSTSLADWSCNEQAFAG